MAEVVVWMKCGFLLFQDIVLLVKDHLSLSYNL